MADAEYGVIGGGLVGMAIAYGLQRAGLRVTVFDEGDVAYRASRGNFGLVWVQSKGFEMPDYARWTRLSASLWPELAAELEQETGIDIELAQPGGFDICLSDTELSAQITRLEHLHSELGDYPFEVLDQRGLREQIAAIGPTVAGATFCPEDGHLNPLYLLRALLAGFRALGGKLENGSTVREIEPRPAGFRVTAAGVSEVDRVVLTAGLGNARLGPMVGINAPVKPNRGQVLVCERVAPFLEYPTVRIRQIANGTVQIGDSKEDVGFDDRTVPQVIAGIARDAVQVFPLLEKLRVVRSWGSLRVMSPDSHPIYERSKDHPGATLVTCHSGVTLAAVHAMVLAKWVAGREITIPYLETFSAKRFDLSAVT